MTSLARNLKKKGIFLVTGIVATFGLFSASVSRMDAQPKSIVVYPFRIATTAVRNYYADSLGSLVATQLVKNLVNANYIVKDRNFQFECSRNGSACSNDPGDVVFVGTVLEIGEAQSAQNRILCRVDRRVCRTAVRVKLQGQLMDAESSRIMAVVDGEGTAGDFDFSQGGWQEILINRDRFWTTQVGQATAQAADRLVSAARARLTEHLQSNLNDANSGASSARNTPAAVSARGAALGGLSVAVIIPEVIIRRPVPDPAAETEIIRYLLSKGVRVKDDQRVRELRNSTALNALIDGTMTQQQMREFQSEYGIDVVVTGEAFAELLDLNARAQGPNYREAKSRVEIRAIEMSTGDVVFSDGVQSSGIDLTDATAGKKSLMQGGRAIAPKLMAGLSSFYAATPGPMVERPEAVAPRNRPVVPRAQTLDNAASDPSALVPVQLEIAGFSRLSDTERFVQAVWKLKGVAQARTSSFAGGVLNVDLQVEQGQLSGLGAVLETDPRVASYNLTVTVASRSKIVGRTRRK